MQTESKTNATLAGIDTYLTHWSFIVGVSSNNDADAFNDALESLVENFLVELELKESVVDFVHEKDRLDMFTNNLAHDSFSLHTDTGFTINNDQSTVSNTKSGRHLRWEVNETWK